MRLGIVGGLIVAFGPSLAFSSDYDVSASDSFADAIAAANRNTDGDTFEISVSGAHGDSGTISKKASITGDTTAELTGNLTFSGSDMDSEINNMKFGAGQGSAITNGIMPEGNAQNLALNGVTFSQRVTGGFGGAVFNIGNMTIGQNSVFENNKADYGGAIYNAGTSKTLKIYDSRFSQNTSSSSGGAINNGGTLEINNSVFDANRSSAYYGGAVYNTGKTLISGSSFTGNKASEGGAVFTSGNKTELVIENSSFVGNYTSINSQGVSDFGGAINSVGKLKITGSLFDGNYATSGGAVKLRRDSMENVISSSEFKNNSAVKGVGGAIAHNDGILSIDQTKFTQNKSEIDDGGAIYTESVLNITGNSEFTENIAAANGGAVSAGSAARITVEGAAFNGNSSLSGNGGAVYAASGAGLSVNGAVFSQNHADNGYGGALYASGDTVLKNVNFDGNSAVYGGGIMNFNNMVIGGNSSFTNNKASAGGAVFTLGTLTLDTAEGNILFRGNEASDVSEGGADIYLNTGGNVEVNIRGDANVLLMDGGFAGTGLINKTGANTLIFGENADNSLFHGEFIQSAGTTEIYADNFFAGNNTVTDGAVLHFMREAEVNNLQLKTGGHLDLRRSGPFTANTLTINELISDGSAVVSLQTDGTTSDLLKIKDSAEGKITLDINAVGSAPTQKKLEVVNVEEADSKAEFKLAGNKVDIGAYEYGLIHDTDTNWYLETEGSLTRTAKSVEGIPSLHLSIVNAGMNELRKRLGDLRSDNPDTSAGVWMRGYGKHLRVHEKMGARMGLLGIEGGFDIAANLLGGKTYFGILGGYLSSDNIRVFQNNASDAKGHTRTPVAGLYASWLGKDKKWFVDLTARHFWVHSDLDNIRDNNALNGYDVKRNFWAFTAETGRQFDLPAPEIMNNGTARIAVEPKLELRYAEGNGKKFKTDTGGTGYVDKTRSLVSRFNVQTSYLPQGKKSTWKLFVELGVFNEWIGKTKVNFAGTDLTTSDLSGLGVETSLGFNAAISEDSYLYSAMTLEAGHTSTSYMFNAGLRVTF